jgi:hypothetical protein
MSHQRLLLHRFDASPWTKLKVKRAYRAEGSRRPGSSRAASWSRFCAKWKSVPARRHSSAFEADVSELVFGKVLRVSDFGLMTRSGSSPTRKSARSPHHHGQGGSGAPGSSCWSWRGPAERGSHQEGQAESRGEGEKPLPEKPEKAEKKEKKKSSRVGAGRLV